VEQNQDLAAFLHLSPLAVVDQGRVVVWRGQVVVVDQGAAAAHVLDEVHRNFLLLLEEVALLPTPMATVGQGANIQLFSAISLPLLVLHHLRGGLVVVPVVLPPVQLLEVILVTIIVRQQNVHETVRSCQGLTRKNTR